MRQQRVTRAWRVCAGLCVGVALAGCARLSETGMVLFATNVPAMAIVKGQMMQGEVKLVPDRTGSVVLNATQRSATLLGYTAIASCMGRLRFTSTAAGEMDLRCNEGTAVTLHFSLISDATGYAYSQSTTDPVSLTFGLRPEVAKAYLTAPAERKLVETADGAALELR
jgi:hypothetical protein